MKIWETTLVQFQTSSKSEASFYKLSLCDKFDFNSGKAFENRIVC